MTQSQQHKKILVTRDFPSIGLEMLKSQGFLVTTWEEDRPMMENELIEKARDHNALLCTLTEKIDKVFLSQCAHLEIISQFAVGYDNIDVAEATRLGIPIGYTPGAMSDATADIAFGLMIATARKMLFMHKTILNGEWNYFRPNVNLGVELKKKTLGIYGLGRIGFEMARRCKGAYEMDILYYNRNPNPEMETRLGATWVPFDELLHRSDVLSVHCALTDETRGVFNREVFKKMKPTAIFINTARGLIHQEEDLINALRTGQIWGAGLDVTNPEPMRPDNPLLFMERVTVLPHIGSATMEARTEMSRLAAENIIAFYLDKEIPNLVNPEVIKNKKRR